MKTKIPESLLCTLYFKYMYIIHVNTQLVVFVLANKPFVTYTDGLMYKMVKFRS